MGADGRMGAEVGMGSELARARVHVVTGKGGTGKTSVAAALALTLATPGRRVLLVEVEGRQGISQTFDVPPLGTEELKVSTRRGGGQVWGLAVDAKTALLEYLQLFYKLGRAGSTLERLGAIDFATTIAPGVRDVLLTGKVYEAAGRPRGGRKGRDRGKGAVRNFAYDAIVLDAPPTGRVARFLGVTSEVAELAPVGPIHSQAEAIAALFRDRSTVVHIVTLLEQMPVQETIDALEALTGVGLHLGAIFINRRRSSELSPQDQQRLLSGDSLEDQLRAELADAGLRPTNPMIRGLIEEGVARSERMQLEHELQAQLAELDLPLITLPVLAGGVAGGGVNALADAIQGGGPASDGAEDDG